jgi:hypothetical protein
MRALVGGALAVLSSSCFPRTVTHHAAVRCSSVGEAPVNVDVDERSRWTAYAVGIDRVYGERGVPTEAVGAMGELLRRERAALTQVVGIEPPPLAVAMLASDPEDVRTTQDAGGRRVQPVRARERSTDSLRIGTVVHEWMHDVVSVTRARADEDSRYLEDGLCDLVSHRVAQLIRHESVSTQLCHAAADLRTRASSHPPAADLVALANENRPLSSGSNGVEAAVRQMCSKDIGWGYSLGLAYWVDRERARSDVVTQYVAQSRDLPRSAAARFAWLDHLAPARLDPRKLETTAALEVLTDAGATEEACAALQLSSKDEAQSDQASVRRQ